MNCTTPLGFHYRPAAIQSEFAVRPQTVIVHNPVRVGAFDLLAGIQDDESLQREFLFRSRPNGRGFSAQHDELVAVIRSHVDVVYLDELLTGDSTLEHTRTNPNQVYTRDALITVPWIPGGYIPGRMRMAIRRGEVSTMEAAARKLGLHPIVRVEGNHYIEGGDVIPFVREGRRALLVGFGRRTTRSTLRFLRDALVPDYLDEVFGIELAPWRINLDGGMVPLSSDTVIAHVPSILGGLHLDSRGERPLDVLGLFFDLGMTIVRVERDESIFQQACNCLCLGDRKLICYSLCERAVRELHRRGFEVFAVTGSELVKGTGGPRCMTRPIYRAS